MTFLRFVRLLSLTLWTGSIFFFAAVEAPILFAVLPTHALAGLVVSHSLARLHWVGLGCGLVFLLICVLMAMLQGGSPVFHARDLLLFAMMGITLYLHFGLERRMVKLRDSIGVIDNVSVDDPRRVEFNRMHEWSTKLEGSVFLLGLGLLYLVVREQETSPRRY